MQEILVEQKCEDCCHRMVCKYMEDKQMAINNINNKLNTIITDGGFYTRFYCKNYEYDRGV